MNKFKACIGSITKSNGDVKHCEYATNDMSETSCPKCGSRLVAEY